MGKYPEQPGMWSRIKQELERPDKHGTTLGEAIVLAITIIVALRTLGLW